MQAIAKTDIGKVREINQDCYYISEECKDNKIKLYIIADGMGGYNGGEIASNLAVITVKKYLEANIDYEFENFLNEYLNNMKNCGLKYDLKNKLKKLLFEACKSAHETIFIKSQEEERLEEMGTTLDVCLIFSDIMMVSHIGDSRIYKINYKSDTPVITQLTVDHSYVQKLVKEGTITQEEAYNHPKKNMLIKALGGKEEVEPDVFDVEINENDIIMMSTDGLTNMIKDDRILKIVSEHNIEDSADILINEANNNGGFDNITVILINTNK